MTPLTLVEWLVAAATVLLLSGSSCYHSPNEPPASSGTPQVSCQGSQLQLPLRSRVGEVRKLEQRKRRHMAAGAVALDHGRTQQPLQGTPPCITAGGRDGYNNAGLILSDAKRTRGMFFGYRSMSLSRTKSVRIYQLNLFTLVLPVNRSKATMCALGVKQV